MLLTTLLILPMVAGLVVLLVPQEKLVRPVALVLSVVQFALSLKLVFGFDKSTSALQFVERSEWIPHYGISYFLGIDGISLWLVVLTTFLVPLIILGSWSSIVHRVKTFHFSLFLLQTAMLGTFFSMDLVLFYVFWELSLIPMYLMIGIWGGPRKIYAAIKFFIYTMFGSVLMLLAMITLMFMAKEQFGQITASVLDIYNLQIPFISGTLFSPQSLMFFAFALAFAIKVPMFPVHTWLPDAHTEAPTPGSVILAGVMLKMGTYGFLRFALPIFPDATEYWAWLFLFLGAIGIVYGALVAMVQPDIKKLVAYSSVSHMGYVVLGMFALNSYGVSGSLYQMLNHGISTGALFLLVGMIYDRTHSREIKKYGGLASALPLFSIAFFIVTLSSIAVPGTNGFIGEYLILMGTFLTNKAVGIVAVTGVIFGAAYMLWMYKRVFFGKPGELVAASVEGAEIPEGASRHKLEDLNQRELFLVCILVFMIFWMGIFPNHFLDYTKKSVDNLTQNLKTYNISHESGKKKYKQANLGE